MVKSVADFRVDFHGITAQQVPVQVRDMDRVVKDRAAAGQRPVGKPAAGHFAVVRAANRQHVSNRARRHLLAQPLVGRRVAARERCRQRDTRRPARLNHSPRIFQRCRQRLFAQDRLDARACCHFY